MAILFDYAVKYNGQYYPPNTPIEEANAEPAQAPEEDFEEAHAEPAQAPEEDCAVAAEETVEEKSEAPKKAAKSRKKGDA